LLQPFYTSYAIPHVQLKYASLEIYTFLSILFTFDITYVIDEGMLVLRRKRRFWIISLLRVKMRYTRMYTSIYTDIPVAMVVDGKYTKRQYKTILSYS